MTGLALFHIIVTAALIGLAFHALLNRLLGPRLVRMPPAPSPPPVSVLVPARNEAATIDRCVRHWLSQQYADFEVFVYDDDSSDDTVARALGAADGTGRLRLVRGGPLPDGWRGKPHACHRLRAEARGEILLFADADVVPAPAALALTAGAFSALPIDAMSAVPSHGSPSLAVRALVAIQNWAALTFVPAWLAATRCPPMFTSMNGQFIAIRAGAYDASGGFAAVRGTLAEDVALGRRLATLGYRVRLVDGAGVLDCEPYAGARDLWRANTRNLLPIFFGSEVLLAVAMAGLAALYLGPLALVALGAILGHAGTALWTWVPLAEVGLGLSTRFSADRRAGYPLWLTLLHPLAVGALLGMGLGSVACLRLRGVVEWRGRRYAVTDDRAA